MSSEEIVTTLTNIAEVIDEIKNELNGLTELKKIELELKVYDLSMNKSNTENYEILAKTKGQEFLERIKKI